MTAGLIVLAVAIVIVAAIALHAMSGVLDNQRAIKALSVREDTRWRLQARVDGKARDLHRVTRDRLDALDERTRPSDGK